MADDTAAQAIDILQRLKTWDVLDATPDGAYVRERLDAAIALIAAVRAETLAEYTLTDTDVDKFLEACEAPVDPERVERIRKLFNEKLLKTCTCGNQQRAGGRYGHLHWCPLWVNPVQDRS